MTVNTNTSDRKALAKAIAEELGTTAKCPAATTRSETSFWTNRESFTATISKR